MTRFRQFLLLFITGAMLSDLNAITQADEPIVLATSFASGNDGAIQAYRLDVANGSLKPIHRTTGIENPYFIVVSPDRQFLYSIKAKTFGGTEHEQVAAFKLDARTGHLTFMNAQSTHGTASCYVEIDKTGKNVLVANYTTGNVASFPVRVDGSLGEAVSTFQHAGSSVDPNRQKGPNAHCFVISPDNRFAFACDLGIDQVLSYRLDPATAKLTPNQPPFAKTPAGAGPRHLTFHPNGKHVYVINELKNAVTVFDYNTEKGVMTERQTISTLPSDFTGVSHCADVKATPDGRYLYGTNRGHDSIACYKIGPDGGLSLIAIEPSLGKGPQNLLVAGNGKLLLCANMPGNNVAVFHIDSATGKLVSAGEPVSLNSPSCLRLLP